MSDRDELRARAARIALVVSDVDGVLTDAGVYYSERGEELKRFSVRDGMAVERLRDAGIETALLTRERSAIVAARAKKLQIARVWAGVRDKRAHLYAIAAETGLSLDRLAYIGDDVNDLAILEEIGKVGLTAAPADAIAEVRAAVTLRCEARGGHGAFRELADWILALREA